MEPGHQEMIAKFCLAKRRLERATKAVEDADKAMQKVLATSERMKLFLEDDLNEALANKKMALEDYAHHVNEVRALDLALTEMEIESIRKRFVHDK